MICAPADCFSKASLGGDDVVFDDVVAENDANLFPFDEGLGEPKRVGDAAFAFLVGVVNAMKIEILAVGKQAKEVAGILAAGDDDDVLDARIHQSLDRDKKPSAGRKPARDACW